MTTIPVFYASDENYIKALAVSMVSVLANTKQYIQFIILENNISLLSKEKLNRVDLLKKIMKYEKMNNV